MSRAMTHAAVALNVFDTLYFISIKCNLSSWLRGHIAGIEGRDLGNGDRRNSRSLHAGWDK